MKELSEGKTGGSRPAAGSFFGGGRGESGPAVAVKPASLSNLRSRACMGWMVAPRAWPTLQLRQTYIFAL